MIDHMLGRPSSKSRRLQVLAVISFWSAYLYRHGPPGARAFSKLLSRRLTAWQTVVVTMLYLYAARNFSALVGLASPEPMANMYDATFFRATWVLTALDAGFWTAMRIRSKWLRDIASIVFSVFYLFATESADEKVRKVRGMLTVEHLRVSWNKSTTPYISFSQGLLRPRFTRWPPRQVRIQRPSASDYRDPVDAWLFYDGPLADLAYHDRVILDIPGGGFVAMNPRCNDDKLFAWAAKSGLPILSLDYKKAPEFPYPYALNECLDVYTTLTQSRGRCIGMSGKKQPRIIITGDSAGGNLAVACTLMILETRLPQFRRSAARADLPPPEGLVCFYPCLDTNIGNWMSDEQMSLIRDRNMRTVNKPIVRRKSQQYDDLVGTPHHSDVEDDAVVTPPEDRGEYESTTAAAAATTAAKTATAPKLSDLPTKPDSALHAGPMKTRLATASMISYFNDRVLTPEMMRSIIILYVGPHNRPDFSTDYLLSPVLAPDALLAEFPKTYFMTGERDPLVDDTVIFAGKLRRAKVAASAAALRRGMYDDDGLTDEQRLQKLGLAEVMLIPGTSHGFMQFPSVYPPAWKHLDRSAQWFDQLYAHNDEIREMRRGRSGRRNDARTSTGGAAGAVPVPTAGPVGEATGINGTVHPHPDTPAESSGDEDRPLEMTKVSRGGNVTENGTGRKGNLGGGGADEPTRAGGLSVNRRPGGMVRNKTLSKLSSEEDLLSRRMNGLAGGLTGAGSGHDE
ncbi:alpha/beta hydrolase fold [Geosmithia morbida]|uniref:Alpha/beta hydrolase fold n=1 Tax=Geosmithia morbida TaxID=1094350 RepID=A0A9P4YRA8_9HYPO|nr:alpha/beta hydrolase fold [Geosmithia morbida]KAF4121673.1 alpha/beta hydrolase fold [Geosmithia morbida]